MAYFLMIFTMTVSFLYAADLGTFGETFHIHEEDLLDVLKTRLSKEGLSEKMKNEIQEKFIATIERPKGKNLPKAKKSRCFTFDPTICLKEDLLDHKGAVAVPKGTKINPLKDVKLNENLLFFDGEDDSQIVWAKQQKGKWILVKGNPIGQEKNNSQTIYFDQGGYLSAKLGITALPAKVSQEGLQLKIEEIPCL